MLTSSNNNVNNSSNQRTKNACESCKVFRRKCNRERPCQRCTQKGVECLYPPKLQKPHRKGRNTKMILMKKALEVAVSLKEKHPEAIQNIFTQAGIVELLNSPFNELQQDVLVRQIQGWNVINFANLTLEIPLDAQNKGNDEEPMQVAFLDFYFAKVYPLFPFFEKRWLIDNLDCIPVELLHLMYTVCLILNDLPQVSLQARAHYKVASRIVYGARLDDPTPFTVCCLVHMQEVCLRLKNVKAAVSSLTLAVRLSQLLDLKNPEVKWKGADVYDPVPLNLVQQYQEYTAAAYGGVENVPVSMMPLVVNCLPMLDIAKSLAIMDKTGQDRVIPPTPAAERAFLVETARVQLHGWSSRLPHPFQPITPASPSTTITLLPNGVITLNLCYRLLVLKTCAKEYMDWLSGFHSPPLPPYSPRIIMLISEISDCCACIRGIARIWPARKEMDGTHESYFFQEAFFVASLFECSLAVLSLPRSCFVLGDHMAIYFDGVSSVGGFGGDLDVMLRCYEAPMITVHEGAFKERLFFVPVPPCADWMNANTGYSPYSFFDDRTREGTENSI